MVIQVKPFFFWYKHTYHTVSKTQKRSVVMIRMKNTLQYHRWRIHSLILAQEFGINLKFHIKGTEYLAIIKRSKTNNWKCTCKGSWRKYRTKYVRLFPNATCHHLITDTSLSNSREDLKVTSTLFERWRTLPFG